MIDLCLYYLPSEVNLVDLIGLTPELSLCAENEAGGGGGGGLEEVCCRAEVRRRLEEAEAELYRCRCTLHGLTCAVDSKEPTMESLEEEGLPPKALKYARRVFSRYIGQPDASIREEMKAAKEDVRTTKAEVREARARADKVDDFLKVGQQRGILCKVVELNHFSAFKPC